jgi:hypothetical protein
MEPSELTVKSAAVLPKLTSVAPEKLVPVMVTEVPPAVPLLVLRPVTVGVGATASSWRAPAPRLSPSRSWLRSSWAARLLVSRSFAPFSEAPAAERSQVNHCGQEAGRLQILMVLS